MSGGLGSTCTDEDIRAPKSKESETQNLQMNSTLPAKAPKTHRGILSFRQLNALAIAIVLSATGMVSIQDIAFVVSSIFYMLFLSKFAFPLSPPSTENTPIFSPAKNKILAVYVSVGALIGLLLPIVYIFHGIYEGDKEGIKAAVPHVFLLSSQVFMEGFAFSNRFSIPIRVFVPVFYNAMRILTIMDWLKAEIFKENEGFGKGSEWRLYVGRGLGVANMAFWSFNLFGFLLPIYLPRAFKRYYGAKEGQD
ncbi:hypothetical protein C5167_004317 [Papaver somniferum]|uniref:DUF7733 domain-containing protein n=1 Tax=Papaver somniferum TaxID=3469 RepID=A0A4Y7J7A7_PAPSO|nr:uncharacterized protein LOC113274466 [Papaver somniferum]RZC57014.1 hypothetical protein C5167_004317 [Papaver somniferum]